MTMETRCCKVLFPNYLKKKSAEDTHVPPLWRKEGKMFVFFLYCLFTRLHAAEFVLSRWKLSTRWSITALATIGLRSRNRINLRPTRLVSGRASEYRWWRRRNQVNPSSRGRGIARGVLRSSPKPKKKKLAVWEGLRFFVACVLQSSAQKFVSDAWPAPATYHPPYCEHCDQRVGRRP